MRVQREDRVDRPDSDQERIGKAPYRQNRWGFTPRDVAGKRRVSGPRRCL